MDYTYTATGTLHVGNCAICTLYHVFTYAYAVGSIVYSKGKAKKGVFEKIFIKKVRPVSKYVIFSKNHVPETRFKALYVDSLNGYWNEDELVSFEVASALVDDYYLRAAALAEQLVLSCK
jgi:hypothetical protein